LYFLQPEFIFHNSTNNGKLGHLKKIGMKKIFLVVFVFVLFIDTVVGQLSTFDNRNTNSIFSSAKIQYTTMLDSANVKMKYPRSSKEGSIT